MRAFFRARPCVSFCQRLGLHVRECIHGPAVNVPTDLSSVCSLLPRLPSQPQILPMKLKRKLFYIAVIIYMYNFVRPDKVLVALEWLQQHNPLYKDIEVNRNWVQQAASDDEALWHALTTQQEDPDAASADVTTAQENCTSLTADVSKLQGDPDTSTAAVTTPKEDHTQQQQPVI